MNYKDSLNYLNTFINYEKKPAVSYDPDNYDLSSFQRLMTSLGSPHHSIKAFHIAGTKGKGSTGAFLASALNALGYKCGFYTSPHLQNIRERITIDGDWIPEKSFAGIIDKIKIAFENDKKKPPQKFRTFFEILTATAFLHFKEQNTDFGIFEVGMGGRLDATRLCRAPVSIITLIGLDHTESLGSSIEEIAAEKAGIIKQGQSVVMPEQPHAARKIIVNTARRLNASLIEVEKEWSFSDVDSSEQGVHFTLERKSDAFKKRVCLPLCGRFQINNALAAISAIEEAARLRLLKPDFDAVVEGIENTKWKARFQIIKLKDSETPLILDGAHNPASVQAVMDTFREIYPNKLMNLIFGASWNKNAAGMLDILAPGIRSLHLTRFNNPKSIDPRKLFAEAVPEKLKERTRIHRNVEETLHYVLDKHQQSGVILATGSLYLVGEILDILER